MATSVRINPDDEEFYGDMCSIGSAKFDAILTGIPLNEGSIRVGSRCWQLATKVREWTYLGNNLHRLQKIPKTPW